MIRRTWHACVYAARCSLLCEWRVLIRKFVLLIKLSCELVIMMFAGAKVGCMCSQEKDRLHCLAMQKAVSVYLYVSKDNTLGSLYFILRWSSSNFRKIIFRFIARLLLNSAFREIFCVEKLVNFV